MRKIIGMLHLNCVDSANKLSNQWDNACISIFQKKEFLVHLETYNPCQQRYYELYEGEEFKAGCVVYSIKTNIFTFSSKEIPFQLSIIGLPVSVSPQGIVGDYTYFEALIHHVLDNEKGFVQIQNASADVRVKRMIAMRAMPGLELKLPGHAFEDYLSFMRSGYRRRVKQALHLGVHIRVEHGSCQRLTNEHYQLYIDVMNATNTRLETLSYESFKYMPAQFVLTTLYVQEGILAWHITCKEGIKLTYYFGGLNYALRDKYHGYYNNLLGIIQEAYAQGCHHIDMGQTAELPKKRLGASTVEMQLFIWHKNPLWRLLFYLSKRWLGYYQREETLRVFNE